MSVTKVLDSKVGVVVVGVAAVVGLALYMRSKGGVIGNAGFNMVNPVLNGAANYAGQSITGDDDWTVAGTIYDWFH